MKKTLIAVAALAATSAFAQVTITGTFDATFRMQSVDQADGTSYDVKQLGKDGIGTTAINFSGTEDLGGGLKASFFYEYDFEPYDANADSSFTSAAGSTVISSSQGQIFVGLEGAFGTVKLGAPNTPSLTVQSTRGGAFGTKDGGRANNAGFGQSLTRFDRSVNYTSPNFSGFSFGLTYVPENETAGAAAGASGTGAKTDIGGFYANGPLFVGVSQFSQGYDKTTGADSGSKSSQTNYVASYNFGFAKFIVGGHQQEVKDTAGAKTTDNAGWNIAADVPLSPALTLSANIQNFNSKLTSNLDKDSIAVGLQYALSKRTLGYARYVNVSTDNVPAGATTNDITTFLVGLRHNF